MKPWVCLGKTWTWTSRPCSFGGRSSALSHPKVRPNSSWSSRRARPAIAWFRSRPAWLAILVKHRATQNRERLLAGERWRSTGLVFTSTIGSPLDERNVRREFYALLKSGELPRIRLHDLRHSCATILLAAGEHPKVVQELLGHSSVQLTLDAYSHLVPDLRLKERAAARLDEVLRQAGKTEARTEAKSGDDTQRVVHPDPTTQYPVISRTILDVLDWTIHGGRSKLRSKLRSRRGSRGRVRVSTALAASMGSRRCALARVLASAVATVVGYM